MKNDTKFYFMPNKFRYIKKRKPLKHAMLQKQKQEGVIEVNLR